MSKKEINLKKTIPEFSFHLQIDYSQKGIQSVSLNPSVERGLHWTFSAHKRDPHLEKMVTEWLDTYCQKQASSVQLPFDWSCIPPFTQQVLHTVAALPFGSLSTYGQIAHLLGRPQAARAVGGACGRNPFLLFVPCHRVLDAKLELRGYSAGGIGVKQQLLTFEGSKI